MNHILSTLGKYLTCTVFIRIEAQSRIEVPLILEGNKLIFFSTWQLHFINSYILSHAVSIHCETFGWQNVIDYEPMILAHSPFEVCCMCRIIITVVCSINNIGPSQNLVLAPGVPIRINTVFRIYILDPYNLDQMWGVHEYFCIA